MFDGEELRRVFEQVGGGGSAGREKEEHMSAYPVGTLEVDDTNQRSRPGPAGLWCGLAVPKVPGALWGLMLEQLVGLGYTLGLAVVYLADGSMHRSRGYGSRGRVWSRSETTGSVVSGIAGLAGLAGLLGVLGVLAAA